MHLPGVYPVGTWSVQRRSLGVWWIAGSLSSLHSYKGEVEVLKGTEPRIQSWEPGFSLQENSVHPTRVDAKLIPETPTGDFFSTFPPQRSQSHTFSCSPLFLSDVSDCSDEDAVTSNCSFSVLPQSTPTRSKNKHTPPSESSQATSSCNRERQTKGIFPQPDWECIKGERVKKWGGERELCF